MAKKKKKRPQQPAEKVEEAVRTVPKFEIGVKGDEFDIAYTRAAARDSARAEALFRSISRESNRRIPELIRFAALALFLIIMSLSFALLSREGKPPHFTPQKLASGQYASEFKDYYAAALPFGNQLRAMGDALHLGFNNNSDITVTEPEPEPEEPPKPVVTEATTEPAVTLPPETSTTPMTTVPTTSETATETVTAEPVEKPDTFRMYAHGTANIRLEPDGNSMIMGYFYNNERVDVVEIRDDGWAAIWFGGAILYTHSDSLSDHRTAVTAEAVTTEETLPEETTEEVTTETLPEITETEPETEPEITLPPEWITEPETTTYTTVDHRLLDPEMSAYLAIQSRKKASEAAARAEEEAEGHVTASPEG